MCPACPPRPERPTATTHGQQCSQDATSGCAASPFSTSLAANHHAGRGATSHRRQSLPFPGPCQPERVPKEAQPAARAGSGAPRAFRLPTRGNVFCCYLVSSRLSKVVRVARFHYNLGCTSFFHKDAKGNPCCYGCVGRTGRWLWDRKTRSRTRFCY